jgi:threonine synthase
MHLHYRTHCLRCSREIPPEVYQPRCPACRGPLDFAYDLEGVSLPERPAGLWDFARLLPVRDLSWVVTLGEGGTPLLPAQGDYGCRVWFKDESRNPTGSQKDRALAVAITKACEFGLRAAALASAGSTGLASAAYCARAGVHCAVLVTAGTPPERLAPLRTLGAQVLPVRGTIEDAFAVLAEARERLGIYETSTYRLANPYQAEGAKTIGYETALAMGEAPDWFVLPVGGGGTLASVWRAYRDLAHLRYVSRLPRMVSVQPARYNALELVYAGGRIGRPVTAEEITQLLPRDPGPTIQVKLAHTVPPDWEDALAALHESDGVALSVTDEQALEAQEELGAQEGLFVEPSSAAALAGLRELVRRGIVQRDHTAVVCLTGSGFRETGVLLQAQPLQLPELTPDEALAALEHTTP